MRLPLRYARANRRYGRLLARQPEVRLAYDAGCWEAARLDERLVARDAMDDNLALVVTALERRGIRYFVLPPGGSSRHRVGVAETSRAATLQALAEGAHPATHLYVDDPGLRARARRIALALPLSPAARARALSRGLWRAYVNRTDTEGRTVLGLAYGCEIEFWTAPSPPSQGEPETLVATRWNRYATELPAHLEPTATLQVRDRRYPTLRQFGDGAHVQDVTFPVDLVYTWVDGADPVWLARKNAVLRELHLATATRDAYDASRYRSRDELKYSLRSVAMFADFVRHVFVVTDDQAPSWLNTDNPRLTVVHHKEIFGEDGRLPTFNSHAIEARLHHIDGLAEHYVYLNDDFLFCRRVAPETFFLSNGLAKFFPSNALIPPTDGTAASRSVDDAARNSQELIRRHFGRITHQKMKHAPYAQRRSVLYEAEEVFADEFGRTAASQFRSPSDLPVTSSFSHYYGYLTGRAVPGQIVARYVELSAADFDRRLRDLEARRNADTLCINDAALEETPDVAGRERRLQEFLDSYWPVKTEFER